MGCLGLSHQWPKLGGSQPRCWHWEGGIKSGSGERELPMLNTVAAINLWEIISQTSHTQQGWDDPITSWHRGAWGGPGFGGMVRTRR